MLAPTSQMQWHGCANSPVAVQAEAGQGPQAEVQRLVQLVVRAVLASLLSRLLGPQVQVLQ